MVMFDECVVCVVVGVGWSGEVPLSGWLGVMWGARGGWGGTE